jgi:hypothetical protein
VPTRISTPFFRARPAARTPRRRRSAAPARRGCCRGGDVAGDLQAQLAGRHDDERLRLAVGALARGEHPLQQGQAEAEGLAGAGRRLADQVGAAQRDRERVLLDGERAGDAGRGQRLHGLRADAQLGEGGAVRADGSAGEDGDQGGF